MPTRFAAGRFFFAGRVPITVFRSLWTSLMTTPPLPAQRGQTILQRLLLLAVIGIVATVVFNYLR
ncbi:MAG: hypothetical protein CK528_00450 [Alcaligenaceae bacterium]|nr:MAG: hypothetical protein CK528_00450 [Alcaligenaceae bacterium]